MLTKAAFDQKYVNIVKYYYDFDNFSFFFYKI